MSREVRLKELKVTHKLREQHFHPQRQWHKEERAELDILLSFSKQYRKFGEILPRLKG